MSSNSKVQEIDDEPDEWDQRINKTGCAEENLQLQLCHADTGDWRKCINEMNAFRECWDKFNNNQRTQTKNNNLKDF
ncbi:Cytochrome c oxidase organization component [Komagataella phaffii CBS 7435]|uniref:Cytochrome c oxidase organization component n=1 Tax=Komagataella phaffii (strain ATCC 76273 / CBS 7435 / CECT 11047 / NRRL Y-11430 / Wegner 21-1) TaxID=981350 RepID=F2QLP9_KOMPC|nr:Cytochrome c oxidase organization component [Komagataella phaffii CBS 7435]CCA37141.1 Cytochrome c oxidase organization component [Komagataella phaffii CBS 7435]